MAELKDYTLLVFKYDRRYKAGETFVDKYEYKDKSYEWMLEELRELRSMYPDSRWRLELVETYVTRVNLMTGCEYQERYDQPLSCSPSSESYWSA